MSFLSNFRFRSKKKQSLYSASQNSSASSLARSTNSGVAQSQVQTIQQSQTPQSYAPKPPPLFMSPTYTRNSLTKGSFQTIVEVPKYVDRDEWLALNLFEFHEYLVHFCNMLSEQIAVDGQCMNGGPGHDYLWIDASKQAVKLVPRTHIEYMLSWLVAKFDDPSVFPTKQGIPFPPYFQTQARQIYVQLFRIFAYIYHNHFETMVHLSVEAHWNSFFCHFISIGKTFQLIDRNEAQPLRALIQLFESQGKVQ